MTHDIRWATEADFSALGEVMYDAVRNGRSRYDERQRAAWTPVPRSGPAWNDRLRAQDVALAEADETVVGFMSLAEKGYIDFAYIRPAAQGSGLFRLLYAHIADHARRKGMGRLWVHASLTAEPAFTALGFNIVRQERVFIGAVAFDRYEMERLNP